MKYIPIENCNMCPHRDHKGGYARIAYIPVCRITNMILGYTVVPFGGGQRAEYDNTIPDWCPLLDLEKEK